MAVIWDKPEYSSEKVPTSATRSTHYEPGNVMHRGAHNSPEGRGVLGDLGGGAAAMDSPVPANHQMPSKATTAHASEVAAAMEEIGSEFRESGVMRR